MLLVVALLLAVDGDPADAAEEDCEPPEPGFLTLDTRPWTVVYVDGEYAGSTPLFRHRLPPGEHTLTMVNEGARVLTHEDVNIEEGRARKMRYVLVTDGASENDFDASNDTSVAPEDCFIPIEEAATLSVDTQPWSKVYVDNRMVGTTPLFEVPIMAGDHVIRLVRDDGGQSFVRITAARGETLKLALSLGP